MSMGELNKIAGAFLGAFLLFLLLSFFSEKVFEGDHHDDVLAYALEIEESSSAAPVEEAVDYAALVASADAGNGSSIWRQCSACHKIEDGANGVGPHPMALWAGGSVRSTATATPMRSPTRAASGTSWPSAAS